MTLRDTVLIVARSWIVIVVTVAVGLVTAAAIAFATTKTYTSSAQVLFTGHAPTGGQDLAFAGSYVQSRMQSYGNLADSTSLLESVAEQIGTDESPRELAERIDIEVSLLNTVATVYATDTDAEEAARTANTAASALLDAVQDLEADNAFDPEQSADSDKATVEGVITGEALVPSSPSDPRFALYLLAGGIAGLVVSMVVVALREVLRSGPSPRAPDG